MEPRPTIAFLGTGLIGRPMAARLLACGFSVTAYNRTTSRAEPLQEKGAQIAASPEEALRAADCAITMLADEAATRETLLNDAARGALASRTVIQMATLSSGGSLRLREEVVEAGGEYFEAPVLGSRPQAASGELIVLLGAEPEQLERWREVLLCFGPELHLIGPVGKAATFKLALNQLIAALTAAFSLSLGMVLRNGIEVEPFMQVLRASALYAPTFDKKLPRMLTSDYGDPNFTARLMLKDVDLVLEEARAMGLNVAALEGVREIVAGGLELGLAEVDYSSLYEAVVPK